MDNNEPRLTATCHCGSVRVSVAMRPEYINECNCGLCGKLGVWWAYWADEAVAVDGETESYSRADKAEPTVTIHRCAKCGCSTHFTMLPQFTANTGISGVTGVNMRLAGREAVRGVELRFPNGADWNGQGQFAYVKEAVIL